ncbi:hypothetical protein [Streptomyces anulatus]|uniref:hypothetical protein n=1 Tax=Streptomyces anulatus TaxID=1892 RepID=UPI003423745C
MAAQIITSLSAASENCHSLETRAPGPAQPDVTWWPGPGIQFEGNERLTNAYPEFLQLKTHTINAALRAERRWRHKRLEVKSRTELISATRELFESSAVRAHSEFVAGLAGLPPIFTSGLGPLNAYVQGAEEAIDSLRVSGSADADWASLQADLAYWRRTADELWRVLNVLEALPAESDDVVFLDTAPCGIRRLTAVRVPRAPGSGRTTPVPSSSLLAAA